MKSDKFYNAINSLEEAQGITALEQQYMSDINNYLAIHATRYLPPAHKDGAHYIPSTAMVRDDGYPRSTVHFALNHIVEGHIGGNWSGMKYVIMTPFNDLMQDNGAPAELSMVDTYFSVNPDKGIILPKSYHIVRPGNLPAGKLYEIRGNTTIYKNENFTATEKQELLEQMDSKDKLTYKRFNTGDLEEIEIEKELSKLGEKGKKLYNTAKDKKAFLRGILENTCNDMLSRISRDIATQATAQQMGFKILPISNGIIDGSDLLCTVETTAQQHNIPGNCTNKGHSLSIYYALEITARYIDALLKEDYHFNTKGIYNNKDDLKTLGTDLITIDNPLKATFIQSIISNKPLGLNKIFENAFRYEVKDRTTRNPHFKQYKTIAEWDANTAETIRRYCDKNEQQFATWRQQISQQPDYQEFINTLRTWQNKQNIAHVLNSRE